MMNVVQNKLARVSEVVAIHLPLVLVDIVGKYDVPARSLQPNPHQADASEELRKVFFRFAIHNHALHLCIFSLLCSIRILGCAQQNLNPSTSVARGEPLASQSGATGGLLHGLSRRFVKSFLSSIAGCLGASGSATGNRAKSNHPQTRRGVAWEK
jgi:hypothetical protein